MRQLLPIKLTISQRLWLGLGVILALFAAADLASLRASHQLDVALASLVDTGAQRNGAAFAMSVHLEEMSRAVQQYMGRRQPRQRERFEMSRVAFEQALNSYRDLASTGRSRALGYQAAQLYADFRGQIDSVMQLEDSQA